MGMFDNVDYQCNCPMCGNKVTGFQSKDGPCIGTTVKPHDVMNFYSSCNNCGSLIEFNAKAITPFVMTVTFNDKVLIERDELIN